jgi:hypothetical protein
MRFYFTFKLLRLNKLKEDCIESSFIFYDRGRQLFMASVKGGTRHCFGLTKLYNSSFTMKSLRTIRKTRLTYTSYTLCCIIVTKIVKHAISYGRDYKPNTSYNRDYNSRQIGKIYNQIEKKAYLNLPDFLEETT